MKTLGTLLNEVLANTPKSNATVSHFSQNVAAQNLLRKDADAITARMRGWGFEIFEPVNGGILVSRNNRQPEKYTLSEFVNDFREAL